MCVFSTLKLVFHGMCGLFKIFMSCLTSMLVFMAFIASKLACVASVEGEGKGEKPAHKAHEREGRMLLFSSFQPLIKINMQNPINCGISGCQNYPIRITPLFNRAAMGRARFIIYPWFIFFVGREPQTPFGQLWITQCVMFTPKISKRGWNKYTNNVTDIGFILGNIYFLLILALDSKGIRNTLKGIPSPWNGLKL